MQTYIVEHAVDFSTGTARIGKTRIVEKREEVVAATYAENLKKAKDKNRIQEVTKEKILALKSKGMKCEQIAKELNCSLGTVYSRLREIERG